MALSREEMIKAMLDSDTRYNGRFITGVLSTGIYCLPSCRGKKPKPENVRFFKNCEEARAAGLRACLKCKPDEFERGHDSELEGLEAAIACLRHKPWCYKTVGELAEALFVGPTKLHELTRRHYHRSPGDLILQAKLAHSKNALLSSPTGIAEIAFNSGFETLSAFNENFKRDTGMTPTQFRQLAAGSSFQLELPEGYPVGDVLLSLGRDPASVAERVEDRVLWFSLGSGGAAECRFNGNLVECRVEEGSPLQAHESLRRMLGLGQDCRDFESAAIRQGFDSLAKRQGLPVLQTPSVWEGIIWTILGQQINLAFTFTLRRRLYSTFGTDAPFGLYSAPTQARIASLEPEDLLPLQFSRRKAEYLIEAARRPVDLEGLASLSATRAEATMMGWRGFGRWSANYVMMRALGFGDCVPYTDTGLTAALRKLHLLERNPTTEEVGNMMAAFAPFRSLATFRLWQSLKD